MEREILVKNLEAKKAPYDEAKNAITSTIKTIIEDALKEAGVASFTKVNVRRDEVAQVIVNRTNNSYGYDMDIYFYRNDYNDLAKRKVQLNAGTLGSTSCDDTDKINFCVVAGELAKRLGDIQSKFDKIDFKPFYDAENAYYKARFELDAFDKDVRNKKYEEQKNAVLSKLVVGAKIEKQPHPYDKTPVYDTVERVTNKLVFLKSHYGSSIKKEKFVEAFLGHNWKFVD